jgi:hypothetical protein
MHLLSTLDFKACKKTSGCTSRRLNSQIQCAPASAGDESSLDDKIKPAVYSHRYTVVETGAS